MREIDFRGKRYIGGEGKDWCYGYLWIDIFDCPDGSGNIDGGRRGRICRIIEKGDYSPEVVYETIGQYTGLKDKAGRKIFEGDIVKWGHLKGSIENPIRIAVVEFNPDIQFRRFLENPDNCSYGQNYVFRFGCFAYRNTEKCLEIIGNRWDTPELLEQGGITP